MDSFTPNHPALAPNLLREESAPILAQPPAPTSSAQPLLEKTDCRIKGRIEHKTDLFEASAINRFLQHLDFAPRSFDPVVGLFAILKAAGARMLLTPDGKVDREALPTAIAEIWQEVLRVEAVGWTDSFFDLGSHWVLLAQVQQSGGFIARRTRTNCWRDWTGCRTKKSRLCSVHPS